MESEWMGRYRPLIAQLVRHGNITVKYAKVRAPRGSGSLMLSAVEWQVLEAVIEHSAENCNMNAISRSVGVPQSTFSKAADYLCRLGLAEKYQMMGNRKNVILKPTPEGQRTYQEGHRELMEFAFSNFFQVLDGVDDAAVLKLTQALACLNDTLDPAPEEPPVELIKKK